MSVSIPRIDQMFLHLDRWRHLPAYQLERRIDIFFSVYLVDVLREITGDDLVDTIIPELPLKRDLVVPGNSSHHSVKVDYAVFTRSRDKVYFVELKTDDQSRRTEQDDYLNRAQALGFRPIVDGIRQILLHTDAHQKYFHLAHSLAALGYLDLPDDLATFHYPQVRRGLTERLEAIETTGPESAIEVVYVQPNANRDDGTEHLTIDFNQFADHVDK
ncbi:MAG: hypothetical protein DRJ42_14240, partial [Deltaproteobacteria bacterium]